MKYLIELNFEVAAVKITQNCKTQLVLQSLPKIPPLYYLFYISYNMKLNSLKSKKYLDREDSYTPQLCKFTFVVVAKFEF